MRRARSVRGECGGADRRCVMCGSGHTATVFVKHGVEYSACGGCGFRFASPDVNPNLANALDDYERAYLQYLAPDPTDAANFDALCVWMERCRPLRGRVLDVGAGSGKFVRHLRARGIEAVGVEPSAALFEHFLAGDSAFACDTLGRYLRATPRQFDIVTAFDVIEHVANPMEFIEHVAAALKPGGAFFVSTPDVDSVAARTFRKWWHFYYPYHLSYFSPKTLEAAAKRHGLALVDVSHRGKRRSIGYMIRYAAEFIASRSAPRWAERCDAWYLPINLFDVMYLYFARDTA